jgi:hypothetical protein
MTMLSLPAISALSRRIVAEAGGALSHEEVIGRLVELDVSAERAEAGVRLAVIGSRLLEAEPADVDEEAAPLVLVLPPTVSAKEAA